MIQALIKALQIIWISIAALAIAAPIVPIIEVNDVEAHLNEFSKYSLSHHDNIDDTTNTHSHVHRHGEDGEEHEHHHNHSREFQPNSKLVHASTLRDIGIPEYESNFGFLECALVSNPHPLRIFRPPIV